jgi:uncharacterized protein
VAGLNGYDAGLLWERYRRGDREAMDRLIAYNRADVVNLEGLLRRGYAMACERTWAMAHL